MRREVDRAHWWPLNQQRCIVSQLRDVALALAAPLHIFYKEGRGAA